MSAILVNVTEEPLIVNQKKINRKYIASLLWFIHIGISISAFTIGIIYATEDCKENGLHIDAILRAYGIYVFSATHVFLFEFVVSHYITPNTCLIMCPIICFNIFVCAIEIGFTILILSMLYGDPSRCDEESKPLYNMGLSIVIINTIKYMSPLCLGACFQKKNLHITKYLANNTYFYR